MFKAATLARACRAGFALAILSASLAQADYGPRTTIGNSYQQTSTTPSANGINEGSCSGLSDCHILFQAAPQQKRLIVQHMACLVVVSAGDLHFGSILTRKGQTLKRTYLLPVHTTSGFWVVNTPVMHLFESGERPLVRFLNSTNANWGVECNISGRLQQP
jgi:hypothetical protein